MAQTVNLRKNAILKPGLVGFSWTVLFFGFFVPIFRGDWKWFLIMLIAGCITVGVSNFVFCFVYNKIYTRALLEEGYVAADDWSYQVLARAGLVTVLP